MALPSSPPALPELDIPTSPPLLSEEAGELPIRPPELSIGHSRKRQFSDYGGDSSDPLFSEGPSDPDDEDEEGARPRRKRLVRGPWYNLRRVSGSLRRGMAKKERVRNFDSGVWMGSDLSTDSLDSMLSSQQRMANLGVEDYQTVSSQAVQVTRAPPTAQDLAAKTIAHCIDNGVESVDISGLGLTDLSNSTLAPLHQLIRHTHSTLTQPPSEDEFSPLTPSIRLFISGNRLTTLPAELFRLTNISVLSLRNNELAQIPPCIGKLINLHELNIAQNNIKWLPWEMLNLMHCRGLHKQINVRPNPLVDPIPHFHGPSPLPRPAVSSGEFLEHLSRWGETSGAFYNKMKEWYSEEGVEFDMRHELELKLKLGRLKRTNYLQEASRAGVELKLCNEQLLYLASSAVRYFDVDGSVYRHGHAIGTKDNESFDAVTEPLVDRPEPLDAVRSLFELALRSIQTNFPASDLNDLPEDFPTSVRAALQLVVKGNEFGNETCSVCHNDFIVPRAEWMEYWFNGFPSQECLTPETVLPFIRRVCSWKCAVPSELGAFRF